MTVVYPEAGRVQARLFYREYGEPISVWLDFAGESGRSLVPLRPGLRSDYCRTHPPNGQRANADMASAAAGTVVFPDVVGARSVGC